MKQNLFTVSKLVAGLILMASCNNEQMTELSTEQDTKQNVTITASMPQDNPNTRLTFEENESKLLIYWSPEGETLSLVNENSNEVAYLKQIDVNSTKTVATFSGDITMKEGTGYYVIYPALPEETAEADLTAIPLDMTDQTGEIMEKKIHMWGWSNWDTMFFGFDHLTSIIRVDMTFPIDVSMTDMDKEDLPDTKTINNSTVTDVTFTAGENEFITKATVDITAQDPTECITSTETATSVKLSGSFNLSSGSTCTVYLHILPCTLHNLTVSATIDGKTYSAKLSNTSVLEAGKTSGSGAGRLYTKCVSLQPQE